MLVRAVVSLFGFAFMTDEKNAENEKEAAECVAGSDDEGEGIEE